MLIFLLCLSLPWKVDEGTGANGCVHTWAVTVEGEVVYRKGVSEMCPAVSLVSIATIFFLCLKLTLE